MEKEQEYVLGTHDEEIQRLGLQNTIWRPRATDAWRRAGFTVGQTLLDVGCGPGWAALDLAGITGSRGRVIGVDVSKRFLEAAAAAAKARALHHVEWHECDLDEQELPPVSVDGAWTRWVYSFVRRPQALLNRVAATLKPGGTMVIHEYVDYRTWRPAPLREEFEAFVREVMASWRAHGGEPDIGLSLPGWLDAAGCELRELRPLVETVRPGDFFWQWPDAFVDVGLTRLVQLGRVTEQQAEQVRRAYRESGQAPGAFQITPMVLEIIAVKR